MDASESASDRSTGQLLTQLSEQTSQLVREELALARLEMKESVKHAGVGVGLFSTAGLLAFFGLATLVATAVIALDLVLDLWLSALIVGAAILCVAGLAALIGKRQVGQASPKPERTLENVQRDVEELKEGRHA